ncbi:TraR/DksA C4-type zinc finger protein [Hydrogenophaga intermedia]|uniref:TraR/DksA C4-type zinc finger protein n=1 Tax=Hydrogenophaga intermedia TaxID=65786 RepID=UPI0020440E7B|nr:TraR/DksA C4-type zinc finger protein [Hydrogenophaga intermedia]MCM3563483.1 TraR/DksA C4-type zinc finger protein [Hydrogenophaga intermedia]
MSGRERLEPDAHAHLRAALHQRREHLLNRLCRENLPTEQADDMVEEVDRLDSALARLEARGAANCLRCGEPISFTRHTLQPDSTLCTGCALVSEDVQRGGHEGPTSTWDAEFLPELG